MIVNIDILSSTIIVDFPVRVDELIE